MVNDQSTRTIIRFGVFEADIQTEELRQAGVRVKLQAQPFRVLTLLLDRPGEIVTRAEIIQELWGNDTFVDFDQSVGAIIRKLRQALRDSATAPRYIETLRHRGYRFLAPVQTDGAPYRPMPLLPVQEHTAQSKFSAFRLFISLTAAITMGLVLWSDRLSGTNGSSREAIAQRAPDQPRNLNAWLAYQKGRGLWRMRTPAALERSIEYFQKAANLDPDYAPAYAGLADAHAVLNLYTGRQRNIWVEQAKAANGRALRLDRSMAEAHATRAYIKFYNEWDWPDAENAFKETIALDPDYATAHQWYAEYLFFMGRFNEARLEINRAHELDPQSIVISLQLASPHMFAKEYDQAIAKIQDALRFSPDFPLGIYMLGTCYEQLGRFDEAISEYRKIRENKMGLTGLGYAYGRSGRQQEARQVLEQLLAEAARDDLSAYHVARVYAGLGDASQTFAWLKKAQLARDERMVMIKVDPKLDTLRSDPLFNDLLRSLGLA